MIEESNLYPEDLLLCDYDYPEDYVNMHHKEDYIVSSNINKQFIVHKTSSNTHYRLLARISWHLKEDKYTTMSFICDTGAPKHLYLCKDAIDLLKSYNLILIDDIGDPYLKIKINDETKVSVRFEETPRIHKNANIIGLRVLLKLGLNISENKFSFNSLFTTF